MRHDGGAANGTLNATASSVCAFHYNVAPASGGGGASQQLCNMSITGTESFVAYTAMNPGDADVVIPARTLANTGAGVSGGATIAFSVSSLAALRPLFASVKDGTLSLDLVVLYVIGAGDAYPNMAWLWAARELYIQIDPTILSLVSGGILAPALAPAPTTS